MSFSCDVAVEEVGVEGDPHERVPIRMRMANNAKWMWFLIERG